MYINRFTFLIFIILSDVINGIFKNVLNTLNGLDFIGDFLYVDRLIILVVIFVL